MMSFEKYKILCSANKIMRIWIIREEFVTFFFFVKLYNRVFQQAGPFVRTFKYLKTAKITVDS